MAYFDLEWNLRTDGQFRDRVIRLTKDLEIYTHKAKENSKYKDNVQESIQGILRLCRYNFALLASYYFPRYPKNKPFSLKNHPFQYVMYHIQPHGYIVIRGSRQIGKEQPYSADVMTPKGWVKMGTLKVGDSVIGCDGKPHSIIDIVEQGDRDVYELTFTDGSKAESGLDHNWVIQDTGCNRWRVETLRDIIEKYGMSPHENRTIRIPLTEPIQFEEVDHTIPSYDLGVLLSRGNYGTDTTVKAELKKLDAVDTIPADYLFDSVENRINLLHGLMDSGGTINEQYQVEFETDSKQLSEDVQFLVQSLGGTATIVTKNTYPNRCSYQVNINLKDINPFHVKHKADRICDKHYVHTRTLKSIRLVRKEQSRCINVDSDKRTYLTNNCIVTHNSVNLCIRDVLLSRILPGFQGMYICPRMEQLKTYADKLKEVEEAYRFFRRHPNYRNNLYYKEYPNKSTLKLMYCLTNASKIRGNTVDQLSFDEYQDFDINLELEVQEVQSASDIPLTIYSGTSLTTDTALEAKFGESSRGIWTMTCPACRHDNQPTIEGDVLSMIRPLGPSCAKCSKLLNVRNGRYIHESEEMLNRGRIGLHIPKIIVPENVEKEEKWMRIYEQSKTKDIRKFYQEVLGIPTAEGEREITRGHLEAMCNDMPTVDILQKKAMDRKYHYVISGCDWGGSDYNPAEKTKESWTVHTMLGVNVDYDFEIIHFRKYGGMDYDSVAQDIIRNHKALNGFAIASDFGVGSTYNMLLRQHLKPDKHLIFQATGPSAPMITEPRKSHLFNHYLINKTETITQLYEAIKSRRIKCYQWAQSAEYLLEFLNLYRTPSDTPGGATTFTYRRHGARPDDTLHAVNFAFILGRILIGEPIFQDISLKAHIEKTLRSRSGYSSAGTPVGRQLPGRPMSL